MKSIGIITIHKINNYGSVFQAYALQKVCEDLGYKVEIIDYNYPNSFHTTRKYASHEDSQPNEPKWIKMLYAIDLIKQHKGIEAFVNKFQKLCSNALIATALMLCVGGFASCLDSDDVGDAYIMTFI